MPLNLPTADQLRTMSADQLKALMQSFEQESNQLNRAITVAETEKTHHEQQLVQLRARIKEIAGSDKPEDVERFIAEREAEALQALQNLHTLYAPPPEAPAQPTIQLHQPLPQTSPFPSI